MRTAVASIRLVPPKRLWHDAAAARWIGAARGNKAQDGNVRIASTMLGGTITGLLLTVGVHIGQLLLRNNFHAVIPGQFYRCMQPSTEDLEAALRDHGIRTVINLRGLCSDMPWYLDECRFAQRADASLVDVGFCAGRLPPVHELRHLLEAMDRSEKPVLIHCRQGVDRTGLASAMALLLYTDTPLAEARGQLSLRYGHVTIGRTRYMTAFYDLYETWLAQQGRGHTPAAFRRWIEEDYCAGGNSCRLEAVEMPRRVPPGKPWAARIRAVNTSARTWSLQPGTSAGTHLAYLIIDKEGRGIALGRAGLFRADVSPGSDILLTVPLPAVYEPGRYSLMIDMVDEQHGWFYQAGSEPLILEFALGNE